MTAHHPRSSTRTRTGAPTPLKGAHWRVPSIGECTKHKQHRRRAHAVACQSQNTLHCKELTATLHAQQYRPALQLGPRQRQFTKTHVAVPVAVSHKVKHSKPTVDCLASDTTNSRRLLHLADHNDALPTTVLIQTRSRRPRQSQLDETNT